MAGVNHDELVGIAEKQFTNLPCSSPTLPTLSPCRFTGSEMRVRNDDMPFAHIAMAVEVRTEYCRIRKDCSVLHRIFSRHYKSDFNQGGVSKQQGFHAPPTRRSNEPLNLSV